MIDFISDNKHHFVYLFIILIALGFYYTVNRLQHNPMGPQFSVRGTIIDIHQTKNQSIVLIEDNDEPIYVSFNKKISAIQLLDEVLIHTNGIVLEKYPPETTGFVVKNNKRYQPIKIEHEQYLFSYQPNNEDFSYTRFQTSVFNYNDFIFFLNQNNLEIDFELDNNKLIVLSWTTLNIDDQVTFTDFIERNSILYLTFKIEGSNEASTQQAFLTIIDYEQYKDYLFKTIAVYIEK